MKKILAAILAAAFIVAMHALPAVGEEPRTQTLRIIATSDLHGKFCPWDYALNAASPSGSMAQLSTAVAQYRDERTILVDAGDTIQDNSADLFIGDEEAHPMIRAINAMGYDVCVTGNHEYNYGLDTVKKTIRDLRCKALTGNVYDPSGAPIADGYTILERDGVRIAVIGMVTPNIARWDAVHLAGCKVTDPLEETRRIIDDIRGQYDVLVGVFHMGIENEYGLPNSGVTDILNACPEFDVMVSAHEHVLIPSMEIGGALVVQNRSQAQTMSVIDLTLEKAETGWRVREKTAQSVTIGDYEADPEMMELLAGDDQRAREDARRVIGVLEGDPLAPENGVAEIPAARVQDTALMDLINEAQLYYSGARVSAAALFTANANLYPGQIRKCDTALLYKYSNTLYKLHMTGAQLKRYMEWTTGYFNTWKPGDSGISVNEDFSDFNYYMFAGVRYEVNLSREPGERIEHLTWPDGTPVRDDDAFDLVVSNYCANSHLLVPGAIFDADDLPTLVEKDVHGEIGGIREMIGAYIASVKGGVIRAECDENWKITGCE